MGNDHKNINTETKNSFWRMNLASETLWFTKNMSRQYINDSDSFNLRPPPLTATEQEVSQRHSGRHAK